MGIRAEKDDAFRVEGFGDAAAHLANIGPSFEQRIGGLMPRTVSDAELFGGQSLGLCRTRFYRRLNPTDCWQCDGVLVHLNLILIATGVIIKQAVKKIFPARLP